MRPHERPRAVVCLAAGASQRPVIARARSLGLRVVAVDRDPGAPGLVEADEHIDESTHDPEAVAAAIGSLRDRYDFTGVLNRSAGPPVVTAAVVSERLGLPGVAPGQARAVIHKAQFLDACRAAGLPVPAGFAAGSYREVERARPELPCVVRPSLAMVGKQAVRLVSSRPALRAAFREARAVSLDGRVRVETFVPGCDVGLVAYARAGRLHPVTLIDEINGLDCDGHVRPLGVAAPSRFSKTPLARELVEIAERVVAAFGIDTSPVMLAFRAGDEAPRIVELHLDLGGDGILDTLLPAATRIDVLAGLVQALSGGPDLPAEVEVAPAAVVFEHAARRTGRVLMAPERELLDASLAGAGL